MTETQWIDLSSHLGLIRVSGNKAMAFLQGQLSNDIQTVSEKHACLAAHLNLKGRILQIYAVFKQGPDYLLALPQTCLQLGLSDLQHYARFSRVDLQIDPNIPLYGLLPWSEKHENLPHLVFLNDNNSPAYVLDPDKTLNTTLPANAKISWVTWKITCLTQGIPTITPSTQAHFLPHYLGLKRLSALSFNKGCYIGQEVVARMEYLAKSQAYHLAYLNLPAVSVASLESIPGLQVVNQARQDDTVFYLLQVPNKQIDQLVKLYPSCRLFEA